MSTESQVTKWLVNNTDLAWTRTGGDAPAVKQDRLYINRSEGYEIRDFILKYYDECNLVHKLENYEITLKKVIEYRKGEKVKTEDLLEHLKGKLEK
jgi:Zn-finger protein